MASLNSAAFLSVCWLADPTSGRGVCGGARPCVVRPLPDYVRSRPLRGLVAGLLGVLGWSMVQKAGGCGAPPYDDEDDWASRPPSRARIRFGGVTEADLAGAGGSAVRRWVQR